MDTLGSIIDKLNTVDMKLWNNQELLYKIRRMSFEEYKDSYFKDEKGAEELWTFLKKTCDLNVQRNQLIDEIDEKIVDIVRDALTGEDLDNGKHIQRKHKTL
jgi:hypothetical protein